VFSQIVSQRGGDKKPRILRGFFIQKSGSPKREPCRSLKPIVG